MRPSYLVLFAALTIGLTPIAYAAITVNANLLAKSTFGITGSVAKGAGTFAIDHPTDPRNKLLFHSFVESPEALNVYDGIAQLNSAGEARIELPDYFEALNKDFTYQFLPLSGSMPSLYIKERIEGNKFVIAGGAPHGEVSWMITGVRHDPYILAHPIITEVEKSSSALMNKGECIYEPLCE